MKYLNSQKRSLGVGRCRHDLFDNVVGITKTRVPEKLEFIFFMRSSVLQPQNNSLFDMFMLTRVYGLYTNNCTLTAGICA